MANLKLFFKETVSLGKSIQFDLNSKFAFYVITPSTFENTNVKLRILLWGHGSFNGMAYEDIISAAKDDIVMIKQDCDRHNLIAIMPVLPRFQGTSSIIPQDSQMLAKPVMSDDWDEFYRRPDIEILNFINDLRNTLESKKYNLYKKIFAAGVSAGANMVNRFSLLYPDIVEAIAIPLAGNYAYPEKVFGNVELPYPFGVDDIETIKGQRYSKDQFLSLNFFLYVGVLDTKQVNDPLSFEADLIDPSLNEKIKSIFGKNQYERCLHYAHYLKSEGAQAELVIEENYGHALAPDSYDRIFEFFDNCISE